MLSNPIINKKPLKIKRALISVFDKSNLIELGNFLESINVEILSTGGSANHLRKAGVNVLDVSNYTKFPEIMDGRVKTINPLIEGGILGLRDKHKVDAKNNNIKWIDLVVCNLYPFSNIIRNENCEDAIALENIDIGGPTMIRSAAKNIGWVGVIVNPNDYKELIDDLSKKNSLSLDKRRELSVKAFGYTAQYDTIIHNYLKKESLNENFNLTFTKHSEMRYGENPHQSAAAYKIPGNDSNNILNAKIHQGKKLSYNNIMDADAALSCLKEFNNVTACVVVKHANPCGVAIGLEVLDTYNRAFNADILSAFGSVIAINKKCTLDIAENISKVFVEIIIAPSFEDGAISLLAKKKNLRVLEIGTIKPKLKKIEYRYIDGGLLAQETDMSEVIEDNLTFPTDIKPTKKEIETMLFGWKVLKHIKSNGILIVKNNTTVGVGAGQVSRVDSVDISIKKSGDNISGSTLCSDAFFPFRDSIDKIANTGIKTIIQPGGSIRDNEVIEACNQNNIAMVFTGQRCFKH